MITDTETTPPTPPTQFSIEDGAETALQFLVDPETGEGCVALAKVDGSAAIEIPITKEDARSLIAALAEFAYPGSRLAATPPAGRG